MKIKAKASGDFKPLDGGSYVAICNAVIDLGLQPGRGQYPQPKHEILLNFELPTEEYEFDGKKQARNIHRRFTASMSTKANLRKFIQDWFGKKFPSDAAASDFDLQKLLGMRCMLNVVQVERGDKTYANIGGASPIPKGIDASQPQQYENFYYNLEAPDHETYQKFPDWLQKTISDRIQVAPAAPKAVQGDGPSVADAFDDDIPF